MSSKQFEEPIPFIVRVGLVRNDCEMMTIAKKRKLKLCSDVVKAGEYRVWDRAGKEVSIETVLEKFEDLFDLQDDPTLDAKLEKLMNKYEIYNQYILEESGLGGGWLDFKHLWYEKAKK